MLYGMLIFLIFYFPCFYACFSTLCMCLKFNKNVKKCSDTLFKTESDQRDTPFKTKHPENHTVSGCTSPLRSHKKVPPPGKFHNCGVFASFVRRRDNKHIGGQIHCYLV